MSEEKRKAGNPRWQKGESGNPMGRPKGSPNKATHYVREAYQKLTEDNLSNMTRWLESIAAEDPKVAFELMLKMSEYVLPKLQRQEITGSGGEDLFKNVQFQFGPPVNDPVGRVQDWDLDDIETSEDSDV